ncbi:Iron transport multicopper oxidase FET3 [Candida parapsilosis]|uniref:Iron transport multicopper oxidase FET3 n=2 Tax=Candida parapsilosis TaxID=5480 RepID=G8B5P9_CANPC|nr:uncharacterized protein CPAR2_603590 [Candida parapsilosis]KAF6043396.1 Iron transport multicopper oxidase FET3 [Candida parapsilosis]KAF6044107.1 Iron transport multicopper oxidase FET3 [Candida parapsilosis]KAF6045273.1 Iron transport multicopper oxidase FET3 [Candida parapsilosis]KAF6060060.1 Iron transport multicopper oxidase FET3 [Candida parapsilosis]KAI5901486.1 Iron transport multicopper oxidase FET3 [Candida parapsilosis]
MRLWNFLSVLFLSTLIAAETHEWWFKTGWVDGLNPDGVYNRSMIGFNGSWPLPTLRVKKYDRVVLHLINGFDTANTTLHFHGMFQAGSTQMDGPPFVTQCPIPHGEVYTYNFSVDGQVGSYWYHSHTSGQYGDGMRGVFIIEEPSKDDYPYDYDEEVVLTLNEHYHKTSDELMPDFLSRFNPTGAEPIIDNILFNETRNATWKVEPNKTYLLRIINTGRFISQYVWIEDHNMTVVEVDGVYTEPKEASMLYVTIAQRYTVLITTKNSTDKNYAFMNKADDTMLDTIPGDLQLNGTNYMMYNDGDKPGQNYVDSIDDFLDDFYLVPLDKQEILDDADYTVTVQVQMDNLGNGINYAFFNNISYTAPKVPTILSVLSAGEHATNELVYGSNTNTFVLEEDEVVDIVLNNLDTGTHPFHLHGHVFQVLERGEARDDDEDPIAFNASDHAEWPKYPMKRDTLYVRPQSYFVIRFKADNPGVWFFHCHIEWHLDQGLAVVFVENPNAIRNNETQQITDNHKQICEKVGVPWEGNAAGNKENVLDLKGENLQHKRLPTGFTARGIVALVFSCVAGVLGLAAIAFYGMQDINNVEERVARDLDVDLDEADESGSHDTVDEIVAEGNSSTHERSSTAKYSN